MIVTFNTLRDPNAASVPLFRTQPASFMTPLPQPALFVTPSAISAPFYACFAQSWLRQFGAAFVADRDLSFLDFAPCWRTYNDPGRPIRPPDSAAICRLRCEGLSSCLSVHCWSCGQSFTQSISKTSVSPPLKYCRLKDRFKEGDERFE